MSRVHEKEDACVSRRHLLRFRKNTIFRIYLFSFTLFFAFSSLFLLYSQSRLYKREISDLRSRVSSAERALAEHQKINSVSPSIEEKGNSVSSSIEEKRKEELFWIEGTGISRNWWYMDVVFVDGERFRYFLHLPPRKADLVGLHRRLSHDSLIHFRESEPEDESFFGI